MHIIKNDYIAYGIFWIQAASSIGHWTASLDVRGKYEIRTEVFTDDGVHSEQFHETYGKRDILDRVSFIVTGSGQRPQRMLAGFIC